MNELSSALNQLTKAPPVATVNPTPVTPVGQVNDCLLFTSCFLTFDCVKFDRFGLNSLTELVLLSTDSLKF